MVCYTLVESLHKDSVMQSFDVFFDVSLNKLFRALKISSRPPYTLIGIWRDVRIGLLQLNMIYEGQ